MATAADVVKGAESTWLNVEPLPVRSAGGPPLSTKVSTTIHECLPAANVAKVPKIKAASGGTSGCDIHAGRKPASPDADTAGESFNDELRRIAAPAAPTDGARA